MKKINYLILLIIFILIIVAIGVYWVFSSNNIANQNIVAGILEKLGREENDIREKTIIGEEKIESKAITKEEEEPDFSEDELESYYAVYKDPYVLHLRKALNGYLNGTNEGMEIPIAVIESQVIDGKQYGLSAFDKSYYKSKFVVLYLDNTDMGGKVIDILFQDKPDKIFRAWVYKLADGRYDLRGFWQLNIPDKELAEIVKIFQKFIQDKEHAL